MRAYINKPSTASYFNRNLGQCPKRKTSNRLLFIAQLIKIWGKILTVSLFGGCSFIIEALRFFWVKINGQ